MNSFLTVVIDALFIADNKSCLGGTEDVKLCRFTHTFVINILASLELHFAMFVL